MVAKAEKCPVCGRGALKPVTVHEDMFGLDLGDYPGEECSRCGETFVPADALGLIQARARKVGLWGLASKVKLARSGSSLVVRIPAKLARDLKVKNGQGVVVSLEKCNRLVLEFA